MNNFENFGKTAKKPKVNKEVKEHYDGLSVCE